MKAHSHRWVSIRKGYPQKICKCGELKVGTNTVLLGDLVRYSSTKLTAGLGQLGMDVATGRPSGFVGGVDAPLALLSEVGGSGVVAVGSPSITEMEPISLTGPASYVAGGFTATFGNLTTLERAIICRISGAFYLFVVTAKATNVATIRCFRAVKAHVHTLTMDAHGHDFASGAATGASNGLDQSVATIGNANGGVTTVYDNVTGVKGATSTGTVASTSSDVLEEISAGVNLSGVTLELLGFGT